MYHRAHALLAAEIAGHWRAEFRPERWMETLAAIVAHDDMEREWESNDHLTEAGTPRDFRLPGAPLSIEGMIEVSTKAQYRSRWVALLNSLHQSFLNEPRRGEDAALDKFMDAQKIHQERWRRELKISKADADKAYALFQWCDRMSLILCLDELPSRERFLEVSKGPDNVRYDVMRRDDGSVTVTPWPFDAPEFTVSVESSVLRQARFENNDAFLAALREAPIEIQQWTFCEKSPGRKVDKTHKAGSE